MTLTKAEMADHWFEALGLNQREAKDIVERFFEAIRSKWEPGEPVKLSGFGNVALHDQRARPGRHPKTGEEIRMMARRVVTFRPGQTLTSRVNVSGETD